MASQIIFQTKIISSFVTSDNINKIIINELNEMQIKNEKVNKSNKGGFQTIDVNNEKICNFFLNESVNLLRYNYNFRKPLKVNLQNLWINENKKNHFNTPHVHPKSNFTGCYYVETTKNGGDLMFINNDASKDFMENRKYIDDESFNYEYYLKPEKNKLYLFPSNLTHMVTPHSEEKTRISVSFNLIFNNG